jgi:hypothetical protein
MATTMHYPVRARLISPVGAALLATSLVACGIETDDEQGENDHVPVASTFDAPGLQEGDLVLENGLGAVIPPRGFQVAMVVERFESTEELVVAHDDDGAIRVTRRVIDLEEPPVGDLGIATASPAPCVDGAYSLLGGKWSSAYRWYFYSSSTPSEMTITGAENALKAAVVNITGSQNSCGLSDAVSATHTYAGRTTTWPNVGGSTTDAWCATYNTTNSVGFNVLPSDILGVTCNWSSGSSIVASDAKYNDRYMTWSSGASVPSGCSDKFMLEAVATHEFGHAFGLGHVAESTHGALTMSTHIGPCSIGETTLGLGDVKALRVLY